MHSTENLRTSPEGSFTSAKSPSLLSNCAEPPAERTTCPPRPGYSSRLCTIVPGGMCLNCSALPGRMSEPATVSTGEGSDILQRIARKNVRALAGRYRRAHFQSHGMQDVALLAVSVMQQRQIRTAVWVVLDGRHFRGHAHIFAPEVHFTVSLLVAAAAVPDHDFALVVAAARTLLRLQQRLFRLLLGDVALFHDGDEPPRRRVWIKALQSHRCLLPSYSLMLFLPATVPVLQILRVLDHLFAFGELDVRLFPIAPVAFVLTAAAHLADKIRGAHARHLHLEDLLHSFLDLCFRCSGRNLKHHGMLRLFHAQAFFRDDRPPDNLIVRG